MLSAKHLFIKFHQSWPKPCNKNQDSYIDLHVFDGEGLDDGRLRGHVAVELVPALVPLDAVEGVAAEVVAAGQVGLLALLDELRDSDGEVGQAVDHCKYIDLG